jgi:hypothetical protein
VDRSLRLDLLAGALDGRTSLPSADELQRLLGEVETGLFQRGQVFPVELVDTAWYLHAVASVDRARERYTLARQRQAFAVSAHIFDLALADAELSWSLPDRLSLGFAAAIGYRRSGGDPNATAITRRLQEDITVDAAVLAHTDTLALEAGVALLGFQTRTLAGWLRTWRRQLADLAHTVELPNLTTTALGATHLVVLGADDLLAYLARGERSRLERAITRFRTAATGQAGPGEPDARWVAAHLLGLADEAASGSLWNPSILPPGLPDLVRTAFTVGNPPVLTLWSPQRDLLTGDPSPFAPATRRMVLSVPTSGGKTLIAQMLAVAHLATVGTSVCYVVPTRSLGREVRRDMAGRVRILEKEAGPAQPDFPSFGDLFDVPDDRPPDVEVMTPERLSHLLRHDVGAVLDRFGMFIFDEAQLIKEAGRGFVLESTIALLHHATRDDDSHQIVLISAALGNAAAIAQWITVPDGPPLVQTHDWRGPRRLHAAFCTIPDWDGTRVERIPRGRKFPYRLFTELNGLIRLRLAEGSTAELGISGEPPWQLVRKATTPQLRQFGLATDADRSTPRYRIASQMITGLGHAGSVLVVTATRAEAQQMARGLADQLPVNPGSVALHDFVRQQLGDDHPLVHVVRHGVGFHHAGLPIEVLEALEDAVRADTLPYLACTSTLTEGVNLPVRTVVIYDSPRPDLHDDARLRGARLVNAIGRAGRAGKETEGWIVLVRAAEPSDSDFAALTPGAADLAITSSLITGEALQDLADLEAALRENADALFHADRGAGADFIGFVWLMLATAENAGTEPDDVDVDDIVASILAAQLSAEARTRCLGIAQTVRAVYARTRQGDRRRWPRTGTSIGSARAIAYLASQVLDSLFEDAWEGTPWNTTEPLAALAWISPAIQPLLNLPENTTPWRFRTGHTEVPVDPIRLIRGWLAGASLPVLADRHLAAVANPASRIEQMVDTTTRHFEHYLAWTVGALIEMVNADLYELGLELRLCPELGAYIRYGISAPRALILMTSGIRSRRLANRIAQLAPDDTEPNREALRVWIAQLGLAGWREHLGASAPEILDLLDFTRVPGRSLLKTLLESGRVAVTLHGVSSVRGRLVFEPVHGEPAPAPLGVYTDGTLVGTVAAQDHADVSALLDTGLDLALRLDEGSAELAVLLPLGELED